ncbi:MAG: hypothetical protein U9Q35_02630 [Pseudomonadota bacterium]|nr:hypothetical protein [Pseudomonadota bacterium]
MQRCPNCRARRSDDHHCRRCGMELTRLLEAEQAALCHVEAALGQLEAGDVPGAIAALEQARTLYREPFTDLLLDFALSLAAEPPRPDSAAHASAGSPRPRSAGT